MRAQFTKIVISLNFSVNERMKQIENCTHYCEVNPIYKKYTLYWYKTATFTLTSLQFTSSFSSFRKHLSWQDRVVQCKTCGCIWLNGELSARAAASVMHSTPIYTCLQAKSDWCRLGAVQFYWIYIWGSMGFGLIYIYIYISSFCFYPLDICSM